MKSTLLFIIGISLCLSVVGCSSRSKNLTTDVGTLAEGDALRDDEFFEEARVQYMRIKTEFPDSPLQVEVDLRIAESYFLEESYPTAASSYEEFIRTYPGRPEIPKALYFLAMSYRNQMPSNSQRDTRPTIKVVDTFTRLLVDFPTSEYAKDAQKFVEEARAQLAEKIFDIGRFYQKFKSPAAAARRFQDLLVNYPESPYYEEAMARRVSSLRKSGQKDEADRLAKEFQEKFPKSSFMSMIEP